MDQTSQGQTSSNLIMYVALPAVSGTHARLEKKGGSLLVTDLDSTNGTYINERRLNPGFPVPIDPGSLLIFGLDPTIPVQFINYACVPEK